ncbi:hypothetical protein ACQ4LE_004236 [Meloidogyne hapla]
MFSTNKNILLNSLILVTVFSLILIINCENNLNEQQQILPAENLDNTDDFYAVDEKRVPHPGSTWRQHGRIRSFYSPTMPDFNSRYSRFSKYGPHRPMFIRYMRSFST